MVVLVLLKPTPVQYSPACCFSATLSQKYIVKPMAATLVQSCGSEQSWLGRSPDCCGSPGNWVTNPSLRWHRVLLKARRPLPPALLLQHYFPRWLSPGHRNHPASCALCSTSTKQGTNRGSRVTNSQTVLGSVHLSPEPAGCASWPLMRTTNPDKDSEP